MESHDAESTTLPRDGLEPASVLGGINWVEPDGELHGVGRAGHVDVRDDIAGAAGHGQRDREHHGDGGDDDRDARDTARVAIDRSGIGRTQDRGPDRDEDAERKRVAQQHAVPRLRRAAVPQPLAGEPDRRDPDAGRDREPQPAFGAEHHRGELHRDR